MPPKREGGPSSSAFRVALVLHAVFEAGVGLNFLATPGKFFPQLDGREYNDALRALLRWFSLSIIVQGLVAFVALSAPANRQLLFMLIFLAYHVALIADGLLAIRLSGTTDMTPLYLHSALAVVFVVSLAASGQAKSSKPKRK